MPNIQCRTTNTYFNGVYSRSIHRWRMNHCSQCCCIVTQFRIMIIHFPWFQVRTSLLYWKLPPWAVQISKFLIIISSCFMEPIIAFLMDWNFNRLSFLYVHSKGKSIYSTGKSSWHFANIAIATYMLWKLFTRFDVTYTYTHLKILHGDLERDEIGEYDWE